MDKRCSIKGCGSRVLARGWCRRHYEAWRRTGSPDNVRQGPGICSESGCNRPTVGRGLCRYHYDKVWRAERGAIAREARHGRSCAFCGSEIPVERNARAIYCSVQCKERSRAVPRQRRHALKQYGLTEEEFDEMVIAQRGRCAICDTTDPRGRGGWCVDHDHDTGEVRGLLCTACNAGLGHFKESADVLASALLYLDGYRFVDTRREQEAKG